MHHRSIVNSTYKMHLGIGGIFKAPGMRQIFRSCCVPQAHRMHRKFLGYFPKKIKTLIAKKLVINNIFINTFEFIQESIDRE
jgi:hypothetical protein